MLSTFTIPMRWRIYEVDYGTAPCRGGSRFDPRTPPCAIHFACPNCGTIWANRLPIPSTLSLYHYFRHVPCPECSILGSLLLSDDELKDCPKPILMAELEQAFAHPILYAIQSRQLKETSL